LGSGVSSIDDRRLGSPDGGCDGDLRIGGSSGSRADIGDGGTGAVGARAGAGRGVPSDSARVVGLGGITTIAGGRLDVFGGWLPVRGGWLPVRGGLPARGGLPVRGGSVPVRGGGLAVRGG
jgi:hypothetical protein